VIADVHLWLHPDLNGRLTYFRYSLRSRPLLTGFQFV